MIEKQESIASRPQNEFIGFKDVFLGGLESTTMLVIDSKSWVDSSGIHRELVTPPPPYPPALHIGSQNQQIYGLVDMTDHMQG